MHISLPGTRTARGLGLVALALALVAAGCGDPANRTVPVKGKVTVNNKPLTGGTIQFHPDESKGNKLGVLPVGTIDQSGNYTVATGKNEGAPVGWYKVTVNATQSAAPKGEGDFNYSVPVPLISQMYNDPSMSPLSVEVVENAAPGAYDLTLKK